MPKFLRFLPLLLLSSCSIQRLAISQLAPALSEASYKMQEEKNWDLFKQASPGSLQLAEILLVSDPGNKDLLALLTKGYTAYGFVVNDTEYLPEKLADSDPSVHKVQAVQNLSKALSYGFEFLTLSGVSLQDLVGAGRNGTTDAYLNLHLDASQDLHLETSFFTGTAWLLLANLRKDDMHLVSQMTAAFHLVDWVCKQRPKFQGGLCPTMKGVYHLARPKSLGGKPDLAVQLLTTAMKTHPDNLLIPVTYMEWYLIPYEKKAEYQKLKAELLPKFKNLAKQHFIPGKPPKGGDTMLNLFNAMAAKRLAAIVPHEGDLF